MEKLKSLVSENLKQQIANTHHEDLPKSSTSLINFLYKLPQFHQLIRDLADPHTSLCAKNKEASFESKRKGNGFLSNGDYTSALACYTQALRLAPVDSVDSNSGKNLVSVLYVNRATLFHKMSALNECVRDCNRALKICGRYSKAWFRRGKANVGLGKIDDAVSDLNVAMEMELSVNGKKQIQHELMLIAADRSRSEIAECREEVSGSLSEEIGEMKLQSVISPDKGRGMATTCNVEESTLVHKEEPYAVIVSKSCRESHCHYCLNELPLDVVPCTSCTVPLYCSELCQVRAAGGVYDRSGDDAVHEICLNSSARCHEEVALVSDVERDGNSFPEHKHECGGVNWPAVLPSDVVLAGRVLAKFMHQKGVSAKSSLRTLELCDNYSQVTPERKLELHLYGIVLLCCLYYLNGFETIVNGLSLSQAIVVLAQLSMNSMAIVRMKSPDVHTPSDQFGKFSFSQGALTSSVEQVQVAQAIYRLGSLFNHSCQPNVHAYFISRSLFIRATEFVPAGCPVEFSYGPQVGQWNREARISFLEDKYCFRCRCSGCSELNLPDLVISAFRCVNSDCSGVVLDGGMTNGKKDKLNHTVLQKAQSLNCSLRVDNLDDVDMDSLTRLSLESIDDATEPRPGYCLSCGLYHDLKALREKVEKAWTDVKSLQDAMMLNEFSPNVLSDASRALDALRSMLHVCNRRVAEAHDILAQAFCLAEDFQSSKDHCAASVKILEALYGPNHIAVGHELIKLATVQLSLDDPINRAGSGHTIDRAGMIFSRYYGKQVDSMFPYLQSLKEKLAV